MERIKVVGIRQVRFTPKDSKQEVNGIRVYFLQDTPMQGLEGQSCDSVFLNNDLFNKLSYVPSVGQECNIDFNRYGRVSGFAPVSGK